MSRPWISTNLAISADGKISSVQRICSGWTSAADHARLLELRSRAEALMVGRGTLESDRMTLTVPNQAVQPLRCIVSANGAFDSSHPIFHQAGGAIHGLITRADARPPLAPELQRKITLHQQPLTGFLNTLRTDLEVRHLHCEGGGQLIHALAALDAIDEFYLTLAGHTLFGGLAAPTATAIPAKYLPQAVAFELTHFESLPELGECFLSYRRKR